ncbi:hypothetical protein M493_14595 [Geobacillus genomosp. 3]|uniref:Uncharacterized protein n=1 Tax=Geobacillus genomosp. 3 TaxID=1921421 RepID=S5Z8K7_GEOG3|nr:hypothetical protein M493_14595 [Geobacillus genomosp. 3]
METIQRSDAFHAEKSQGAKEPRIIGRLRLERPEATFRKVAFAVERRSPLCKRSLSGGQLAYGYTTKAASKQ